MVWNKELSKNFFPPLCVKNSLSVCFIECRCIFHLKNFLHGGISFHGEILKRMKCMQVYHRQLAVCTFLFFSLLTSFQGSRLIALTIFFSSFFLLCHPLQHLRIWGLLELRLSYLYSRHQKGRRGWKQFFGSPVHSFHLHISGCF